MSIHWKSLGYTLPAALDAYLLSESHTNFANLAKAMRVNILLSVTRLFFITSQTKKIPSKITLFFALGSCALFNRLNETRPCGQRPSFQVAGLCLSFLSMTARIISALNSRNKLSDLAPAFLDGYCFYRMLGQSWITAEHEFKQAGYSFRATYQAPLLSGSLEECLICYDPADAFSFSDRGKCCSDCTRSHFETKTKGLTISALELNTAYIDEELLARCPVTRDHLPHTVFSISIWDASKSRWKELDVQWINK